MTSAISLTNVSKKYWIGRKGSLPKLSRRRKHDLSDPDYIWALRDITLEIPKGDSWGVIGKNGSGKTTLLRIISGITTPTYGEVVKKGTLSAMLAVGVGFKPELSGRENIYLNGALLGMSRSDVDQIFDRIVDFSEVPEFIDVPVKRYSSGMRVRLGFSVAAHLEPDILLIDEVLAVGDVSFRQKAINRLKDMANEYGRTLLFVSHNMAAIQSFCTKAILLDHGKIVDHGSAEDVVQSYMRKLAPEVTELDESSISHEGTQQVTITGVEILDKDGKETSAIMHGDSIKIQLQYQANEDVEYPVFSVSIIGIENEVIVSRFHSVFEGFLLEKISGTASIQISLSDVPWMPGNYRIVASVESTEKEIYDRARGFKVFEVLPSAALLKSKYQLDQTHMAIHMHSSWSELR